MPKHSALPGYALAKQLMSETTCDVDALFDDVLDGCDLDDPETGARPKRPTPDTCLDALLILRLMSSHAEAGSRSMLPQPGTATLILAPGFDDVKRLRPLIEKLNVELMSSGRPRPQHLLNLDIITQPRAGASTYDMRRFNENIRDVALRGHPALVIATSKRALDPDILTIASATLQLPPATRAMLDAILKLLFPNSRASTPQLDLRGLGEMQLAQVFAADTAAGARKALRALTPAMVSGDAAPAITLDDVHGQPKVKAAFSQLVADLEAWKAGDLPWSDVTSSFLLKGPPGTGKTMLAEALSGSTGLTLVKTSYSECQRGGHQGDMLRELNTACERAISAAPSVLFIDEMDSFHARGGSGNFSGYITGVVNGLLVEIDRVNATPGVVLLAASNFADRIDPAIIRPGRLDQHLEVGPLDRTGVRSLICATIPDTLSPEEAEMLADQLSGQSGARVAALLRDARTRARRERRPLSAEHVFQAAEAVAPVPDPAHLRRVAVHEAGHLLMGHLSGFSTPKRAALRGHGGEIVRDAPDLLTPSLATAMIRVSLAGRVAEAMVFDEVSSGSGGPGQGSDLASATRMALQIELSYGFSSRLSWHDPGCTLSLQPQEIRTAVETRLREAEAAARAALAPHRDTLERIASVLTLERDLDQARLSELLRGIAPSEEDAASDTPVPRAS